MPIAVIVLILVALVVLNGQRERRRLHPRDSRDALPPGDHEELARVREMVEDLSSRFHRLEMERDFYKDLASPASGEERRPDRALPGEAPLSEETGDRELPGPDGEKT